MKGLSQKRCLSLIEKDIATVMDYAIGIIVISPDNKSFELIENRNPRLGILAIVGPSFGFGHNFDQVILAEVGIGASRPYHTALGLNYQKDQPYENQPYIPKRRKWFYLTETQYHLVATFVFKFIIEKAKKKILENWKSPYFYLPTSKKYWDAGKRRTIYSETYKEWPKGTRFSFSKEDEFFLSDVYWAELNINQQLANQLKGLGHQINMKLASYKNPKRYRWVRPFNKLSRALEIYEEIEECPLYLRNKLLQNLPGGKNNFFYYQLQDLFKLPYGVELPEEILARKALLNPQERLGNIQLRVKIGLERREKEKKREKRRKRKKGKTDHISFEVIPHIKPEEEKKSEKFDDIPFDDIPF